MTASDISSIIRAVDSRCVAAELPVRSLLTDSRKLTDAEGALFFAIKILNALHVPLIHPPIYMGYLIILFFLTLKQRPYPPW